MSKIKYNLFNNVHFTNNSNINNNFIGKFWSGFISLGLVAFILTIFEIIFFFFVVIPDVDKSFSEISDLVRIQKIPNSDEYQEMLRLLKELANYENYYRDKINGLVTVNSVIIILLMILLLFFGWYKLTKECSNSFCGNIFSILDKSLLPSSLLTVGLIIFFQVYFYFFIAKSYNYPTENEILYAIYSQFK